MNSFCVMFHHFHDFNRHICSQGSISSRQFKEMIYFLQSKYSVIDAEQWYLKALKSELLDNEIALSFDDALSCQYEIAAPILEEMNIKAFWFVYSSHLTGVPEKLEIFRDFRFRCFKDIDEFYNDFFTELQNCSRKIDMDIDRELLKFDPKKYLSDFTFYTEKDRKFRFVRDIVLKTDKYYFIMQSLMSRFKYDIEKHKESLWIKKDELIKLHNSGHIIGLHSHTHPTSIGTMSCDEQMYEYKTNKEVLENILHSKIKTMSYPCNSYSRETDNILKKLDIELGFDASMNVKQLNILHMRRTDHTDILKEMEINENNSVYKQSAKAYTLNK